MVFDFLKRGADDAKAEMPGEAKASATGPVIAYGNAGRVAWSPARYGQPDPGLAFRRTRSDFARSS